MEFAEKKWSGWWWVRKMAEGAWGVRDFIQWMVDSASLRRKGGSMRRDASGVVRRVVMEERPLGVEVWWWVWIIVGCNWGFIEGVGWRYIGVDLGMGWDV